MYSTMMEQAKFMGVCLLAYLGTLAIAFIDPTILLASGYRTQLVYVHSICNSFTTWDINDLRKQLNKFTEF